MIGLWLVYFAVYTLGWIVLGVVIFARSESLAFQVVTGVLFGAFMASLQAVRARKASNADPS